MSLPFSQACENNKDPILAVLRHAFADVSSVLEVGSGTGQHAVYFAQHLNHLRWQPSDQGDYLSAVRARVQAMPADNLAMPVHFDVLGPAPEGQFDALFSANTCHIMPEAAVQALFEHLAVTFTSIRKLCIYGPFKVDGKHTSDSNAQFDASLKQQDSAMGIRDREWIIQLAKTAGFSLDKAHPMPANNQLLAFSRN